MDKIRVLFLCVHNSARSQMAEAFLKKYSNDKFDVVSAGLEPGILNPNVVEVMKEIGIDISMNKTKSAFELYKQGLMFSYVITVCSKEAAEKCPIFPGVTKRLHWPFDDPSSFTGTKENILEKTRQVRDNIESKVKEFIYNIENNIEFREEDLFILTI
jgi:arsenate reductase